MGRTYLSGLAIACAAITLPQPLLAATRSGTVNAVTLRPLSLVNTEDLDFGNIIATAAPGTVRVNEDTGARTTTGGALAAGGAPRRAEFVGLAAVGLFLTVAIGPSPTLTNGTGGNIPTLLAVQGGTGLRLFPGTTVQTFRVGGTANIAANQQQGDYTGTFTLTVNYF